jgi:hypothetical protein
MLEYQIILIGQCIHQVHLGHEKQVILVELNLAIHVLDHHVHLIVNLNR